MPITVDKATPLIRYLRVQESFERALIPILQEAQAQSLLHLKQLEGLESTGNEIRRQQIRQAQAAINRELSQAFVSTGQLIKAKQADAAAVAAETVFNPIIPYLEKAGYNQARIEAMMRSQEATAKRGVQNAISRVELTSRPLSEKVYSAKVLASGQLDRIITSGIARGVSATELANLVRPFIDPNTAGGAKYAAQRLGRTELNNAFHGTQVQQAVKSPFVPAMRWHLSGSHPRPDECNDYETGGDLKDGLWTPENVPGKPHPQCLCWLSPEVPPLDDFLKSFESGEYNDWLVENGSTAVPTTGNFVAAPKKSTVSPKTTPTPKFPKKTENPAGDYRNLMRSRPGGLYGFTKSTALDYYKGYGYSPVNNALRGVGDGLDSAGKKVSASKIQSTIKGLDTDFKRNSVPLPEDTTVMRGLRPGSSVSDYVEGEHLVEAGYSSTTLNPSVANGFTHPVGDFMSKGHGDGWIIDVKVPKGTRTLIPDESDRGENEILLNRNTKFKVLKVDKAARKIWMEVLP